MPRAGLTEDRVVLEAERIADEVGLRRFTLAALAERLGVRQPSLYKHITSMEGLQRSIAIRAKLELAEVLGRATVGRAGADAVRAMCRAYRSWALAHPGRYAATVRALDAADAEDLRASTAAVDVVFGVLGGYGLSGDDAIDAARALRAALHGFHVLERGDAFGLPAQVQRSFDRLVDGLVVALEGHVFGGGA